MVRPRRFVPGHLAPSAGYPSGQATGGAAAVAAKAAVAVAVVVQGGTEAEAARCNETIDVAAQCGQFS